MQDNSPVRQSVSLLWVGLTFPPAPGGAARYTEELASAVDRLGVAKKLMVLAERFPNQPNEIRYPNGISEIRRVFSYRAGRNKKNFWAYLRYGSDSLRLSLILLRAISMKADAVVFHGWYLLYPSLLTPIISTLKLLRIMVVIDIRDNYLSDNKIERLSSFDLLICCSQNIVERLQSYPALTSKIRHIPVPLTPLQDEGSSRDSFPQFDLKPYRYIFSASGVSNSKRFPLLYHAWRIILEKGIEMDLVVGGRTRDWSKEYDYKTKGGRLIVTGPLAQNELLSLYQHSAVSVNTSNNESFGRTPLEAIEFGRPMIFPSGVPEFHIFSNRYISRDTPEEVANQIIQAIEDGHFSERYDFAPHDPITVAKETLRVIANHVMRTNRN